MPLPIIVAGGIIVTAATGGAVIGEKIRHVDENQISKIERMIEKKASDIGVSPLNLVFTPTTVYMSTDGINLFLNPIQVDTQDISSFAIQVGHELCHGKLEHKAKAEKRLSHSERVKQEVEAEQCAVDNATLVELEGALKSYQGIAETDWYKGIVNVAFPISERIEMINKKIESME